MRVHIFKTGDPECHRWTDVQAGDMVRSSGTLAYSANMFANRTSTTNCYTMGGEVSKALLLVMSRFEGIPGEPENDDCVTFVCMSRHGVLVIVQYKSK